MPSQTGGQELARANTTMERERAPVLVAANKMGHLGNRLWAYAHLIGFAVDTGAHIWNTGLDDFATLFEATQGDFLARFPRREALWQAGGWWGGFAHRTAFRLAVGRLGRWPRWLGWRTLDIGWDRVVDLDDAETRRALARYRAVLLLGWRFQGPRALERHSDAVREHLTPTASYRSIAEAHVARIRDDCDVLVGIHIRQNEAYRTWFHGGRHYYTTAQYAEVARRTESLLPGRRVGFLVCSERPQPRETFGNLRVSFGHTEPLVDLLCLASCDYLVTTLSTFGMWAAFYGRVPALRLRSADGPDTLEDYRQLRAEELPPRGFIEGPEVFVGPDDL